MQTPDENIVADKNAAGFPARILGSLFPGRMSEVVRGAGVAFLFKVATAGLGFLFNIAVARLLGADNAGIYFLALTVITFAAILGRGGMDNVILRFTAANSSAGAWGSLKRLYLRSMLACLPLSALAAILVALSADGLAVHLFSKPELAGPLRWMSLAIVPLALAKLHSEMLRGLKKIPSALTVFGIGIPGLALAGFLLISDKLGVLGVVWSYTAAAAVMAATGFLLWRHFTNTPAAKSNAGADEPIASSAFPLLLVAVTQFVLVWFSTFIVGVFADSADVGIYHVAVRTASLTSFVLVSVNVISAPIFSALHSNGKMEELESVARKSVTLVILFAGPILLIFMIFPEWVMSWFGERFREGGTVLAIVAIGQFFNSITGSVAFLLMMSGHERVLRNITLAVALFTVALNLVLVPVFGTLGAAIATAVCLASQNIACFLFVKLKLGIWVVPLRIWR